MGMFLLPKIFDAMGAFLTSRKYVPKNIPLYENFLFGISLAVVLYYYVRLKKSIK